MLLNFLGYAWERFPEGSLVVDVGGGVGSQSLLLANHHPQLRFVIQDRESVVGDGVEVCALIKPLTNICYDNIHLAQYWKKNMPDALESGRVKIQGSSLSLLQYVLLVWADNFWGSRKHTTFLTRNLRGTMKITQRASLSSSLAECSTTGQTSIASPYSNICAPLRGPKPNWSL